MRQILSKDSAVIISKTEVFALNHPSTIYTDDDVIVRIGKTELEVKSTLLIEEIKMALFICKIAYTEIETKSGLLVKLDTAIKTDIEKIPTDQIKEVE